LWFFLGVSSPKCGIDRAPKGISDPDYNES